MENLFWKFLKEPMISENTFPSIIFSRSRLISSHQKGLKCVIGEFPNLIFKISCYTVAIHSKDMGFCTQFLHKCVYHKVYTQEFQCHILLIFVIFIFNN